MRCHLILHRNLTEPTRMFDMKPCPRYGAEPLELSFSLSASLSPFLTLYLSLCISLSLPSLSSSLSHFLTLYFSLFISLTLPHSLPLSLHLSLPSFSLFISLSLPHSLLLSLHLSLSSSLFTSLSSSHLSSPLLHIHSHLPPSPSPPFIILLFHNLVSARLLIHTHHCIRLNNTVCITTCTVAGYYYRYIYGGITFSQEESFPSSRELWLVIWVIGCGSCHSHLLRNVFHTIFNWLDVKTSHTEKDVCVGQRSLVPTLFVVL